MGDGTWQKRSCPLILEVEKAWHSARDDQAFWDDFHARAKDYIGRPLPPFILPKPQQEGTLAGLRFISNGMS